MGRLFIFPEGEPSQSAEGKDPALLNMCTLEDKNEQSLMILIFVDVCEPVVCLCNANTLILYLIFFVDCVLMKYFFHENVAFFKKRGTHLISSHEISRLVGSPVKIL